VSASSAHRARSLRLGADHLSPQGCCESVRVYSFTFFKFEGWGSILYLYSSHQLQGDSSPRYAGARSSQPCGGKFKIRQSLFQGALTGKGSCLSRDLKPRELVASACPDEGLGLGGFLVSSWRVGEMTVVGLEQRKKSKCKADQYVDNPPVLI